MSEPVREHVLESRSLGPRTIWALPPAVDSPISSLLILLDGEFYLRRMPTISLIGDLQRSGEIRPFWTVFVPQGEQRIRWRDTRCSEAFADFLADELVPWAKLEFACDGNVAIGGLSLSGLQAAYAVVKRPKLFTSAFCQSPSFWWRKAALSEELGKLPFNHLQGTTIRVSCGLDETQEYVEHGPELIQEMSQLESCRRVCKALQASGAKVSYHEIPGGHNFETWTADLPDCLRFVMK